MLDLKIGEGKKLLQAIRNLCTRRQRQHYFRSYSFG